MKMPIAVVFDQTLGTAEWARWRMDGGKPSFNRWSPPIYVGDHPSTAVPVTEAALELVRELLDGKKSVEVIDADGNIKTLPPGFFLDCVFDVGPDDRNAGDLYPNGRWRERYRRPVVVSPAPDKGKPQYPHKRGGKRVAPKALMEHPELVYRHNSALSAAKEMADWFVPPITHLTVERYIRPLWTEMKKAAQED